MISKYWKAGIQYMDSFISVAFGSECGITSRARRHLSRSMSSMWRQSWVSVWPTKPYLRVDIELTLGNVFRQKQGKGKDAVANAAAFAVMRCCHLMLNCGVCCRTRDCLRTLRDNVWLLQPHESHWAGKNSHCSLSSVAYGSECQNFQSGSIESSEGSVRSREVSDLPTQRVYSGWELHIWIIVPSGIACVLRWCIDCSHPEWTWRLAAGTHMMLSQLDHDVWTIATKCYWKQETVAVTLSSVALCKSGEELPSRRRFVQP